MSKTIRDMESVKSLLLALVEQHDEDSPNQRALSAMFIFITECLDELMEYKRQEHPEIIQEGWNAE